MCGAARVALRFAVSAWQRKPAGRGARWRFRSALAQAETARRSRFREEAWDRRSVGPPRRGMDRLRRHKPRSLASLGMTGTVGERVRIRDETHRGILRLQGLDALGHVTIIDVA